MSRASSHGSCVLDRGARGELDSVCLGTWHGPGARPPGLAGYHRVRGTSRTCCVLRRVCTRHMHCICTTPCQPPMRGTERAADHRASLCPPAPSVMHSQSRHVWPSVGFATYFPSTLTCVSLHTPPHSCCRQPGPQRRARAERGQTLNFAPVQIPVSGGATASAQAGRVVARVSVGQTEITV